MILYLAFHDGTKDTSANGAFYDKLISWRTGSPYVHVEMCFGEPGPSAVCYSSVPETGVRVTHIDLTGPQWKCVALPGVDAAKAWAMTPKYSGERYDWAGIIGFAVPWGLHVDDDKFCSEVAVRVLQDIGYYPELKAWKVTPGELYTLVTTRPPVGLRKAA